MGNRLRGVMFMSEFKERFGTVMDQINKAKLGCDVLRENAHFKVFLKLSLDVANTLNEVNKEINGGLK